MTLSTSEVAVCCSSRLAQFAEQPRVLDGDNGLGGEVRHQLDLLVGEWAHFLAVDADGADQFAVLEHRHVEQRSRAANLGSRDAERIALGVGLVRKRIDNVDGLLGAGDTPQTDRRAGPDRPLVEVVRVFRRDAEHRDGAVGAVFEPPQDSDLGLANTRGTSQHGLEYGLQLAGRRTDDAEHLRCRRLLLQPREIVGRSRSSLSSRVFSMAMTACAAKFETSSICLSVNGRTS